MYKPAIPPKRLQFTPIHYNKLFLNPHSSPKPTHNPSNLHRLHPIRTRTKIPKISPTNRPKQPQKPHESATPNQNRSKKQRKFNQNRRK